jgi:hypothetical protein
MEAPSRIVLAKRRLRIARIAAVATAATAFVVFGAAARAAHPASSHSSNAVQSSATAENTSQSTFDFAAGSLGAATTNSASVQSSGS